jgi:hypothetical protein
VRADLEDRSSAAAALAEYAIGLASDEAPEDALDVVAGLGGVTIGGEFVGVDLRFCLPRNPMVNLLRWRVEANLAKIRQNRNYAGLPRQLQTYATPVDPTKIVKAAAAGNLDFEELAAALSQPPPIYRYSYLVDRAKQLAQAAQQLQNSMFAAIKEGEEANYRITQARQDVQLERANVTLQGMRVREAEDGKALAEKQRQRAVDQRDHYADLLASGLLGSEMAALALTMDAALYQTEAAIAYWASAFGLNAAAGGQALSATGSAFSSWAAAAQTRAGYERRAQDWELQVTLGNDDIAIAYAGITLADDRIRITDQEKSIADLRLGYASDTVEFLQDRFANAALYRWMKKNLKRLYRDQFNLAISMAKAAQHALEFERQASLDFINYDYWEEERQGLLGSELLMRDIEEMDNFRLSTATRKKEVEKTMSLASAMPAEFQRFRQSGILDFGTIMPWFDRDFPGHYMRLIRDVDVTILALVPPNEGIHATLSNNGLSRVMVEPPFEQLTTIYRLPESVALSGAYKATGLFQLRPDDPMLLPFEGAGVDTTWRLEMPRGANRFDYDTLYDVLFTVRYTALEDRAYRAKVLESMQQNDEGYVEVEGVRYFSLRNDFPDQWYYLFNPEVGLEEAQYWDPVNAAPGDGSRAAADEGKPQRPYTLLLDLAASDFVPNESGHRTKKARLALQLTDRPADEVSEEWSLPVTVKLRKTGGSLELTEEQAVGPVEGVSGSPFGAWRLALGRKSGGIATSPAPATGDLAKELKKRVQDIWLIVDYAAYAHYNKQ